MRIRVFGVLLVVALAIAAAQGQDRQPQKIESLEPVTDAQQALLTSWMSYHGMVEDGILSEEQGEAKATLRLLDGQGRELHRVESDATPVVGQGRLRALATPTRVTPVDGDWKALDGFDTEQRLYTDTIDGRRYLKYGNREPEPRVPSATPSGPPLAGFTLYDGEGHVLLHRPPESGLYATLLRTGLMLTREQDYGIEDAEVILVADDGKERARFTLPTSEIGNKWVRPSYSVSPDGRYLLALSAYGTNFDASVTHLYGDDGKLLLAVPGLANGRFQNDGRLLISTFTSAERERWRFSLYRLQADAPPTQLRQVEVDDLWRKSSGIGLLWPGDDRWLMVLTTKMEKSGEYSINLWQNRLYDFNSGAEVWRSDWMDSNHFSWQVIGQLAPWDPTALIIIGPDDRYATLRRPTTATSEDAS